MIIIIIHEMKLEIFLHIINSKNDYYYYSCTEIITYDEIKKILAHN